MPGRPRGGDLEVAHRDDAGHHQGRVDGAAVEPLPDAHAGGAEQAARRADIAALAAATTASACWPAATTSVQDRVSSIAVAPATTTGRFGSAGPARAVSPP